MQSDREGFLSHISPWAREHVEEMYYSMNKAPFRATSSKTNYTPLHIATESNDVKAVKSLLIENADCINAQSEDGWTPLHVACRDSQQDNQELIKILLDNNADTSLKTDNMFTPLQIACFNLHGSAVGLLLEQGVDVNVKDSYDRTVLHHMAGKVNARFERENTSYEEARAKKQAIAEALLKHGADVEAKDKGGKTPIFFAAAANDVEITNMLITRGSDVNVTDNIGHTPLYYAAHKSPIDYYGVEIAYTRINVSENDDGNEETLKLLLKSGASVEQARTTVLHSVICSHNDESRKVANNLLKSGYDIDAKDSEGLTALHFACKMRRLDMINLLLSYGADINAINNCPISFIILRKHIIKLLLAGLKVNEYNYSLVKQGMNQETVKKLFKECAIELRLMGNTMIGDTKINYIEILKDKNGSLMRNDRIVHTLETRAYAKDFPEFAGIICRCFNEGRKRIKLIDAFLACNVSRVFPNMPVECIEKVLSYLENDDLKLLIDSTGSSLRCV